MGTNKGRRIGRVLAPALAALALYAPVKEYAGGVLEQAGRTAHDIHTGMRWLADVPDHIRGLIGEQTRLDTLVSGLEGIGIEKSAISAFEESYRSKKSIEGYVNDAVSSSAHMTMDLNEAIRESSPWLEPYVRFTSALRNRTSGETADAYRSFINEIHAFSQVSDQLPEQLEHSIERDDAESATRLITEYATLSEKVSTQGLRFHDTVGSTLSTLQEELRSELGDERYEQLRSMNDRERDRWGTLASVLGSVAIASAGAFTLRKPLRLVGGAAGSTLAYFGGKLKSPEEAEPEPELKWS